MFLCASGIVFGCERPCICLLVESLWPVNGHVLSASGIDVACDRLFICVLVESLPVIGHVFVSLLNRGL
jgi:hypothetical protein